VQRKELPVISLNAELFHQQLTGSDLPVLVVFGAPWCGYCRRLEPALGKLTEQYAHRLAFRRVDIDQEPLLAIREQIEAIPTLVLYQKDRDPASFVAPESRFQIEDFLQTHLNL